MDAIGIATLLNVLMSQFLLTEGLWQEEERSSYRLVTSRSTSDESFWRNIPNYNGDHHGLGTVLEHILRTYMNGCHTMLLREGSNDIFTSISRSLTAAYIPITDINLHQISIDPANPVMQKLRRPDNKVTCRLFIFDLTSNKGTDLSLKFMDAINFFLMPDISVAFVGTKFFLYEALNSKTLWNTVRVLYLSVELTTQQRTVEGRNRNQNLSGTDPSNSVIIYSRCLFCNQGEPGVQFVNRWNPNTGFVWDTAVFQDEFLNMMGHKMKIVQMPAYPLLAYTQNSGDISTAVTPVDSMDVRVLIAVSEALNFTYEMRAPWDNQWGSSTGSGNWTGMVGTLQYHKADFGMVLTLLRGRAQVTDYSRVHLTMPFVLVMSKPRPPPPYMAIIYPLTGDVWAGVIILCLSAGIILWILQISFAKISHIYGMQLDSAILNTFCVMFEEPITIMPKNSSGLVFMGFWLVYCTLILLMYKSSLISHLSAPGKSDAIDSFEEMVESDGWTWGYGDTHSAEYEWMKNNLSPTVQKVMKSLEIQPYEEQVERILKERHILLISKFTFMSLKAATSKIHRGYSPFYFGKTVHFKNDQGWAFRQNAPFKPKIDLTIQRLGQSGIIDKWVNELLGTSQEEEECERGTCIEEKEQTSDKTIILEDTGKIVLGLSHLQSAFYVQAIGLLTAGISFVVEGALNVCTSTAFVNGNQLGK